MASLVGGHDPAFEAKVVRVQLEVLLKIDPDIIVLERTSDVTPQSFCADRRWKGLKAVQTRRVYTRPPGIAFTTTGILEFPLYARWLAELLYPNLMQPELRQVMAANYKRTLGYAMSQEQLDQLLAVDDNRYSAGYGRFTQPAR